MARATRRTLDLHFLAVAQDGAALAYGNDVRFDVRVRLDGYRPVRLLSDPLAELSPEAAIGCREGRTINDPRQFLQALATFGLREPRQYPVPSVNLA
jgi:hypothetical protein